MAVSTLRAESAHVTSLQFDPVDWLARFKEVGGWWLVGPDDKISLGRMIADQPQADRVASSSLLREIDGDSAKAAAVLSRILADLTAKGLRDGQA